MIYLGRILLTIAALQYSVIPAFVDLSPSHVFHDGWPGHAKFHMVWQLTIIGGVAAMVIAWLWLPLTKGQLRLRMACVPGFVVLGGFFVTVALTQQFGGTLSDPPHQLPIMGVDGNVFAFGIALLFQCLGTFLIWRHTST